MVTAFNAGTPQTERAFLGNETAISIAGREWYVYKVSFESGRQAAQRFSDVQQAKDQLREEITSDMNGLEELLG